MTLLPSNHSPDPLTIYITPRGEIFHPLRWTPHDAVRFRHDVEAMERAGLVIRMPANWRMNQPSRPPAEATVGSTSPSVFGMDALLDFRVAISLDGEVLTEDEIDDLSTLKARSPRPR
jgi:SNF2 Helicase protein